eukprot:gb/GECH01005367.1/.p1 GENE.gb/GECH01005367.1/~~gb/GECH01005367.1/.p1  ORF type:complete len:854 (+),score=292.96 gb/GECH01005367.1/:1-2562(+)
MSNNQNSINSPVREIENGERLDSPHNSPPASNSLSPKSEDDYQEDQYHSPRSERYSSPEPKYSPDHVDNSDADNITIPSMICSPPRTSQEQETKNELLSKNNNSERKRSYQYQSDQSSASDGSNSDSSEVDKNRHENNKRTRGGDEKTKRGVKRKRKHRKRRSRSWSSSRSPSKSRSRSRSQSKERSTQRKRREGSFERRKPMGLRPPPRSRRSIEREQERERQQRIRKEEQQRKQETANLESSRGKQPITRKIGNESNDELLQKFRTGGVYMPPFKMAQMQKQITDRNSKEYQRLMWDALKKSLNGIINKVNVSNIREIVKELFNENVIRGRGLLCRACMKAQAASPAFTNVYAALVAVINMKLPDIGRLLVTRVVLRFRKAFRRNDKINLIASAKFLAHLVNQLVVDEVLILEILTLLLEKPTDDSVEVAVSLVKECGASLSNLSPKGINAIFERLRGVLHEGDIDKRVQYMIEGLFAIRKKQFRDYPSVTPDLDLVPEEEQITHELSLEDSLDPEESLDFFHYDPEFSEKEQKYEGIKKQILGEELEDVEAPGSESSSEEESSDEEDQDEIQDETEQDVIDLQRRIYLTIMSSLDFEECAHKLLKHGVQPGQEIELANMIIRCCSEERTYLRFYGLLAQRFCMLNRSYQEVFEESFQRKYSTIHRLDTNKIRNIAKLYVHLLYTDAISWAVLEAISLTEEETTSSSRIFIKILFQELSEYLGLPTLKERLQDETLKPYFQGLFPTDNAKHVRFAINFFTSIHLGGLTEELRETHKRLAQEAMQRRIEGIDSSSGEDSSSSEEDSDSDSDSDSSDSSSSSGSSGSSGSSDSSDYSSDHSEKYHRRKKPRKR